MERKIFIAILKKKENASINKSGPMRNSNTADNQMMEITSDLLSIILWLALMSTKLFYELYHQHLKSPG